MEKGIKIYKIKILDRITYVLDKKGIEVTEEDLNQIGKTKCFDLDNNCVVYYDNTIDEVIKKKNNLRSRRQLICFPIINRGQLWYDNLSKTQKSELNTWYKSWLDVTETMEEPEVPEFLSKELEKFYVVPEKPIIEQNQDADVEETTEEPLSEDVVEEQINDETAEEIIIKEPINEENIQSEETTEQEVTEDEEI